MSDPKVFHGLPHRYRPYFRLVRTDSERQPGCWYFLWECLRCGRMIQPNTAGAQSHIAAHVKREVLR